MTELHNDDQKLLLGTGEKLGVRFYTMATNLNKIGWSVLLELMSLGTPELFRCISGR